VSSAGFVQRFGMATHDSERVLAFWLEPKPKNEAECAAKGQLWFAGGPEIDREIRDRFQALTEAARRGELDDWLAAPRSALALVIVLDQFSRNLYRGSPESFSADGKALAIAEQLTTPAAIVAFDAIERWFLALPFCHAEDLAAQKRSVALVQQATVSAKPEWRQMLTEAVDYHRKHLDVVARFGRFPHRNAVLGRTSTPEEVDYLAYLKAVGQWL
jgi:uncharacterized protein (DUF924 family)